MKKQLAIGLFSILLSSPAIMAKKSVDPTILNQVYTTLLQQSWWQFG